MLELARIGSGEQAVERSGILHASCYTIGSLKLALARLFPPWDPGKCYTSSLFPPRESADQHTTG